MKNETIEKMKKAPSLSSDEVFTAEVVEYSDRDPLEVTKERTLRFLRKSFEAVERDRSLKEEVGNLMKVLIQKEMKKIEEDKEASISLNQAAGLFQMLGADTTAATDSLLQILKPVPNTQNPWTERRNEDLSRDKAFSDITPQEMQALPVLNEFLKLIAQQGKGKNEE